jgi:hypothetical protein
MIAILFANANFPSSLSSTKSLRIIKELWIDRCPAIEEKKN